jgi:hypothetical protein
LTVPVTIVFKRIPSPESVKIGTNITTNQEWQMEVDLGDADASIGIGLGVVTDYLRELRRIGRLPDRHEMDRSVGGQVLHIVVLLDPPTFEMVTAGPDAPRTILQLTGTIEATPVDDPDAPPATFPLSAAVRLTVVIVPDDGRRVVAFRYDGVEGTPSPPVTAADINEFMTRMEVQQILDEAQLSIVEDFVQGLNESRFSDSGSRPPGSDWPVSLSLTPAGNDTVDAFVVSAGPPDTTASLGITESFVLPRTGLAVAFARSFLDLLLDRAEAAAVGGSVDGSVVTSLTMDMADTGIQINGHVVRPMDLFGFDSLAPDVDIFFDGIAVPRIVRGTTGMTMDTSGIYVDVDDTDEIFYTSLQWVLTIGASALLFTGVGFLTAVGIGLWLTAVQAAWNGAVEMDNAPNVLRENLAAELGAVLGQLAEALDEPHPAGDLTVDGTPDSASVVDGNIVAWAQVLIVPLQARLRSAEYSHTLRRFAIFELDDRRRFRAQELARLMKAGKISVSGFHHVDGDYVRSDHDNLASNNLLQSFESNETNEIVVANR